MNDQSLTDTTDDPTGADSATMPGLPGLADTAVETLLTFEEVLAQAKLVERTARICVRGDLVDIHDELLEELAALVDADGNVMSEGEAALADQQRATDLNEQLADVRRQMAGAMMAVKFRAMPEDEWEAWDKAMRGANGEPKNLRDYTNQLISKCAVEFGGQPRTLTVADVEKLRKTLTSNQVRELYGKAHSANTAGGLDVPKLPSFLHGPKPPEYATS